MDEHQLKALRNQSKSKLTLLPSKAKRNTLPDKVEIKGQFHTIMRNPTCGERTRCVVVYLRITSSSLISMSTSLELRLMKSQENRVIA